MATSLSQACTPATFNPSLFGADILGIQATVKSASCTTLENTDGIHPAFCNVAVLYTHPGQHDYITIEEWLPLDNWNGRFLAVGGGGWSPGRGAVGLPGLMAGLDAGFVTVTTDAGLADNSTLAAPWALLSPGNVDLFALQNLMGLSLNDEVCQSIRLLSGYSFLWHHLLTYHSRLSLANYSLRASTAEHLAFHIGMAARRGVDKA
jgi:hypothetical protein